MEWSKTKLVILGSLVLLYLLVGVGTLLLLQKGIITPRIVEEPVSTFSRSLPFKSVDLQSPLSIYDEQENISLSLQSAQSFTQQYLVKDSGHVDLYYMLDGTIPKELGPHNWTIVKRLVIMYSGTYVLAIKKQLILHLISSTRK